VAYTEKVRLPVLNIYCRYKSRSETDVYIDCWTKKNTKAVFRTVVMKTHQHFLTIQKEFGPLLNKKGNDIIATAIIDGTDPDFCIKTALSVQHMAHLNALVVSPVFAETRNQKGRTNAFTKKNIHY
jgi:hypothetical protein